MPDCPQIVAIAAHLDNAGKQIDQALALSRCLDVVNWLDHTAAYLHACADRYRDYAERFPSLAGPPTPRPPEEP